MLTLRGLAFFCFAFFWPSPVHPLTPSRQSGARSVWEYATISDSQRWLSFLLAKVRLLLLLLAFCLASNVIHVPQHSGAKLLMYPGAFNTTTGPAHWELLQRARAVDNQVYTTSAATLSPSRSH